MRATIEAPLSLRQAVDAIVGLSAQEEPSLDEMTSELRSLGKEARDDDTVGYVPRMEHVRKSLKFLADMGAHPKAGETRRIEAAAQLHMVAGLLTWFGRSE